MCKMESKTHKYIAGFVDLKSIAKKFPLTLGVPFKILIPKSGSRIKYSND